MLFLCLGQSRPSTDDLVLIVNQRLQFVVERAVLAARSAYVRDRLGTAPIAVHIPDLAGIVGQHKVKLRTAFRLYLDAARRLQRCRRRLSPATVFALVVIADRMQDDGVRHACDEFIVRHLPLDQLNFAATWQFVQRFRLPLTRQRMAVMLLGVLAR